MLCLECLPGTRAGLHPEGTHLLLPRGLEVGGPRVTGSGGRACRLCLGLPPSYSGIPLGLRLRAALRWERRGGLGPFRVLCSSQAECPGPVAQELPGVLTGRTGGQIMSVKGPSDLQAPVRGMHTSSGGSRALEE